MSKTCYIAIKLATMLYLKYLWFYSFGVQVQFMTINSRASFS
jgi:hypothetical protein